MNVLMLDPKTVCVEETEVHQMDQLDKLNFEVVPVPFRDAYPFGGALHCATTDVYRESSQRITSQNSNLIVCFLNYDIAIDITIH